MVGFQLVTDVNIAVAVEAVQAIGNLASGLRKDFTSGSKLLLPVLLVSLHLFHGSLLLQALLASYFFLRLRSFLITNLCFSFPGQVEREETGYG